MADESKVDAAELEALGILWFAVDRTSIYVRAGEIAAVAAGRSEGDTVITLSGGVGRPFVVRGSVEEVCAQWVAGLMQLRRWEMARAHASRR